MTTTRIFFPCLLLTACLGCGGDEGASALPRHDAPRTETSDVAEPDIDRLDDPMEVVHAAIEAHGGEANFAKADIGRTTMTIDGAFQPGVSGKFTKFDVFETPGKHKRLLTGDAEGHHLDMTWVINDGQGWMQVNGGEPTPLEITNPGQPVYPADNLNMLLAFTRPHIQLSMLPEEKIDGRPAYRIRVEAFGQWAGDSFFDIETHLLVASKKELFDNMAGRQRSVETYYSAYKKVDGLQLPMAFEMVADGETMAKVEVTEVVFEDKINEDEFAKPVAKP